MTRRTIKKTGARALKTLQDGIIQNLEETGAEIRNARMIPAPPHGFWVYLEYGGQRYKLQLEALDEFYAA